MTPHPSLDSQQDQTPEQLIKARDPRNRRFWLVLSIIAALVALGALSICSAASSFTSYLVNMNRRTSTPVIVVTGTIERIAAMPLPPDATLVATTIRKGTGGTFDFTTRLRPQQVYGLYYLYLTQRNRWLPGSQQVIEDDYANFRFYPGTVPRLTIVTIRCDPVFCNVHVDY